VRNRSGFSSRCVFVSCLCTVFAFVSLKPVSAQTKPNIMSWGENISSWNEQLGVLALREGCSIYPTECEPYLDNLAALANVKTYYVSMPFSVTDSVSWAKEYSTLSLSHKMMVEIGFDDFVNKIENDQVNGTLPNPAAFVSDVIAATKSANPNLAFGVTIYEDSLTHPALLALPATLRAEIQYVHLYLHYRENGPNYASYVATAKTIFPKAKIIAGAYPYDRIDYLPCAYKGTVSCTAAQEQSLYKQALQIQLNMVKAGTIYGLEFFFGYFGDPQDWPSWTSETRICHPARLSTCYENSKTLQNISLEVLQSTLTPAVSLSHTSLYMGSEKVGVEGTPGKLAMTNSGGGPLSITGIGVSGINKTEFPLTHNCPATLAAGASCTLTIYFKPAGTGTRSGEIVIFDNAGTGSQTVTLTGTGLSSAGTAAVYLPHTSLYMGSEVVGVQGTPGKLVMTNTGTGTLSISSISVTGTNSTNFPLSQNCGTSLVAKASCTLVIYFRPSAVGTRTGSIVIKDNAGSGTQTVTLTGLGLT
jgi:hypothetical protein